MNTSTKLFALEHCDLGYEDKIILSNFSWSVRRGERWAIVGPNGVGKTTLLRTLLGLLPCRRGHIQYFSPDGSPTQQAPRRGYLPQINHIDRSFPIQVWEVIDSGIDTRHYHHQKHKAQVDEFLKLIDLQDYAHTPIGQLSGGQLQRVLLARAMVSNPDLIVLDEPTSFLDKGYKIQFEQLLERLAPPHSTIVMVTHDATPSDTTWQILPLGQW